MRTPIFVASALFLLYLFFYPDTIIAQQTEAFTAPIYTLDENIMNDISGGAANNEEGWTSINCSYGITNYKKDIPETSTRAYKGICIIDSPVRTVYKVVSDVNNHCKWVKFCKSSILLATPSPETSVQYYNFDIPWPFSDRDIVVNTKTDIDLKKGKIVITSNAASDFLIPEKKNCVRLTKSCQQWILEQVTPSSTKVTFKSYTPLQGSVPKLIRKFISNVIPFSTLKSLKKISANQYMAAKTGFSSDSEFDSLKNKGIRKQNLN